MLTWLLFLHAIEQKKIDQERELVDFIVTRFGWLLRFEKLSVE